MFVRESINVSILNKRSKNSLYIVNNLNGRRLCREIRARNGEEIESVSFGLFVPARCMSKNIISLMGRGEILEMDAPEKLHGNLVEAGTVQVVALCKRCKEELVGWSSSSSSSDSESDISDYLEGCERGSGASADSEKSVAPAVEAIIEPTASISTVGNR